MTEYLFTGRIHPDLFATSISSSPRQISVEALGLTVHFRCSAAHSDLLVWATPSVDVSVETLRNYVHEGISTLLDAEGMRTGRAFTVEIRSVVLEGGEHRRFDTGVTGVADGPVAVAVNLESV